MAADPESPEHPYVAESEQDLLNLRRGKLTSIPFDQPAPPWLEDASEIYSTPVRPRVVDPHVLDEFRSALEAEGIPCFIDIIEDPLEEGEEPGATARWRVMVPGELNLRATSVLDRDFFNSEFVETWKNHLQMLSDDEVTNARPELIFCGLFDRVERVSQVWQEELERRKAG